MLAMFDLCYEPVLAFDTPAHYKRVALPGPGGMESQPARLMQELTAIEDWATDELNEDIREYRKQREGEGNGRAGTRN